MNFNIENYRKSVRPTITYWACLIITLSLFVDFGDCINQIPKELWSLI
jgi:hypothetical protein